MSVQWRRCFVIRSTRTGLIWADDPNDAWVARAERARRFDTVADAILHIALTNWTDGELQIAEYGPEMALMYKRIVA